jgi:alanine racemase
MSPYRRGILGDMVFIGICIAILSNYPIAGVPADSGVLTRDNCSSLYKLQQTSYLISSGNPGDAANTPQKRFDTVRFGHSLYGFTKS